MYTLCDLVCILLGEIFWGFLLFICFYLASTMIPYSLVVE